MTELHYRPVRGVDAIDAADWDRLAGGHPLLGHAFLRALEVHHCVGAETGWIPTHLVAGRGHTVAGILPLYLKTHSYGEYVFDWAWADAYRRHRRRYYPKLLAAVPFTPVPGARLLATDPCVRAGLIEAARAHARRTRVSSLHVLFPEEAEADLWESAGFLIRHGVQFHWNNAGYADFAAFLGVLSHDKRKKIRQERRKVAEAGVTFRRLVGAEITESDWRHFYACYERTYALHGSSPYLTPGFFGEIGRTMGANVLLVVGSRDGAPLCSALNIIGADRLYGRYWGTLESLNGLHFETCYYQGIEFAIERGLAVVEGGAQGAHKLARGFLPVRTFSAHWIADPDFAGAIAGFLEQERDGIAHSVDELAEHSPYRAEAP